MRWKQQVAGLGSGEEGLGSAFIVVTQDGEGWIVRDGVRIQRGPW